MTRLNWDAVGSRRYETGVDRGVLYLPDANGNYVTGVAWNGLTTVTESPSGAESSPQYADNIKYLNLLSAEDFGATIEAFTYPNEFGQCDGTASPQVGVSIAQQPRKLFGFSYRTGLGNDLLATAYGYTVHVIYGAQATPSEKAYSTVNDSPEALSFSWDISTVPVAVTGYKPTAHLKVDSTQVTAGQLQALEDALYGTAGTAPRLPLPDEIIGMFSTANPTAVTPVAPAYNATSHVITVPSTTGLTWRRSDTGATVAGGSTITLTTGQSLVLRATPNAGYTLAPNSDDDFAFTF
jgi:hypothetical protein